MREDARACPLSHVKGMTLRVLYALEELGCETLGDVAKLTEAQLLRARNFGPLSLGQVKHILRHAGLELSKHERPHGPAHDLHEVVTKLATLTHQGTHIMAAIDNLKASVDNAVDVMTSAASEMAAAADFIRNHPPAQNDAELQAMADRLQAAADAEKAAADALHGVDQP